MKLNQYANQLDLNNEVYSNSLVLSEAALNFIWMSFCFANMKDQMLIIWATSFRIKGFGGSQLKIRLWCQESVETWYQVNLPWPF